MGQYKYSTVTKGIDNQEEIELQVHANSEISI